jgi:uncharacterized membrane protein YccC
MVPLLIIVHQGWLSTGIPFLFGALFVSLTDSAGPLHHRRNGMLVATALNTVTVFMTSVVYHHQELLIVEVAAFSFLFSLLGIYGARAGAVGTLALVMMLIHMSPIRQEHAIGINALLTLGGGLWYTTFSLLLNRLQPYRLVQQALGENLLLTAAYIRTRADFYTPSISVEKTNDRVLEQQVEVLKSQQQLRELLFRTRQFVGDASPRSRSAMMIFLESLELFEEALYSYQDYATMQSGTAPELLAETRVLIVRLADDLSKLGLSIQAGQAVKKMPRMDAEIDEHHERVTAAMETLAENERPRLQGLHASGQNIRRMYRRLRKIVQYSRMEAYDPNRFPDQELEKPPPMDPLSFSALRENFTLRSNHFRYAVRLTTALMTGYLVSALFELSHAYWVMLTVLTILKPVYNLTRARNIQRVVGTLLGIVVGSLVLFLTANTGVLIFLMIGCMVMAYSLLRVNYFGFVTFLTIYILITFHFLNPVEFNTLIGERMIDTAIGSVIAALASRFIFPVWQQYSIGPSMKKMMLANTTYFLSAWNLLRDPEAHRKAYNAARNDAIVAITNLSDNFQQMLAEPGEIKNAAVVHQFVIANLTLTSRISAFSESDLKAIPEPQLWAGKISDTLQEAGALLDSRAVSLGKLDTSAPGDREVHHSLALIYSLARDIRNIARRVGKDAEPQRNTEKITSST